MACDEPAVSVGGIVILGAGQAGFQAAASLREVGFDGAVTLIGAEAGLPYQRPPLSKTYLVGATTLDHLHFRPAGFFARERIDYRVDPAIAIDRPARRVSLASGAQLPYDHLVLAMGSTNRVLTVPGATSAAVMALRTVPDADRLAARLAGARNLVVIGAGFVGLELAASVAARGLSVTVIDVAERPMARALSVPMAEAFAEAHAASGLAFRFSARIARIRGDDESVEAVELASGEVIPADCVIYGIGATANTGLARDAGLDVEDGVMVDATLLTSDPAISAIGDVARFPGRAGGRSLRLESVQNAVDQARHVAARLVGKAAAYDALPWFWSDQGALKLQIAGLGEGHDRVVPLHVADPAGRTMLLFRQERLIAVETMNRAADFMAGKRLLTLGPVLTPAMAEAPDFDLRAFTKGR